MLLFPKKPKFIKSFLNKKITNNSIKKTNIFRFSKIGLVSTSSGLLPNFQIESIRLFLRRILKKRAQIFFRVFPNQPITKKPSELRLGRGKGNFKYWSFYAQKGKLLVELTGQNIKLITLAMY